MTEQSTAVANRRAAKTPKETGYDGEPHPIHTDPEAGMRRPYILESGSLYKRLEADLNYADTELETIHVNQRALAAREADLIAVRDATMSALGVLQQFHSQQAQEQS